MTIILTGRCEVGVRVFIAGIMQGSLSGNEVHSQDYRDRIREIVARHRPDAEVISPWDLFPDSVTYGPAQAKETLIAMAEEAGRSDIVVAYLPEASMGTALEMWTAREAGRVVLSISPLRYNWVVQCLSDQVFDTMEEFEEFVAAGRLEEFDKRGRPA